MIVETCCLEDRPELEWAIVSDLVGNFDASIVLPLPVLESLTNDELLEIIKHSIEPTKKLKAVFLAESIIACGRSAQEIALRWDADNIRKDLSELDGRKNDDSLIARAYWMLVEALEIKEKKAKEWELLPLHQKQRRRFSAIRKQAALAITERDGKRCAACDSTERLEIDHIKPLVMGGSNEIDNLQWLCRSCNLRKGTQEIDYRTKVQNEGATWQ